MSADKEPQVNAETLIGMYQQRLASLEAEALMLRAILAEKDAPEATD